MKLMNIKHILLIHYIISTTSIQSTLAPTLTSISIQVPLVVSSYSTIPSTATSTLPLTSTDDFGTSVSTIIDVDNNSVNDLIIGASSTNNIGAIYILHMQTNGLVSTYVEISASSTFTLATVLDSTDRFGWSVSDVSDLNSDTYNDIAVGAINDDDGSDNTGAVYVIMLGVDALPSTYIKLSTLTTSFNVHLTEDQFGSCVDTLKDIDDNGVDDIVAGARFEDSVTNGGALYLIHLDYITSIGLKTYQRIDGITNSFTSVLSINDAMGYSVCLIGGQDDLDNDGVYDLITGVVGMNSNEGGVVIIMMNSVNQVKTYCVISSTSGSFTGVITTTDMFGYSVSSMSRYDLSDIDYDDVQDVIVGALEYDGKFNNEEGTIFLLLLTTSGRVKSYGQLPGAGTFTTIIATGGQFGAGIASFGGDMDGDGSFDIAVGSIGTVYIISLSQSPTLSPSNVPTPIVYYRINTSAKISSTQGSFTTAITTEDLFGWSIAILSDIDNDSIDEIIVGAIYDDDGGTTTGSIFILFIQTDGSVDTYTKISPTSGGLIATINDSDYFGSSLSDITDIDDDSIHDIGVGAISDDDGGFNIGCVYIIYLLSTGVVNTHVKISKTSGSFNYSLPTSAYFGASITSINDIDGDNINDIAVGAIYDNTFQGSIHLLMLKTNSNVKTYLKISQTEGGMETASITSTFGASISLIGGYDSDLDHDSIYDLITGVPHGGVGVEGSLYIMLMKANNTVKTFIEISDTSGSFTAVLTITDDFGHSLSSIDNTLYGDIDGDNIQDVLVGARKDDDGGSDYGCVYIIMLTTTGVVKTFSKMSSTEGGFTSVLNVDAYFGCSVSSYGDDITKDGFVDIVVGVYGDDDGGNQSGSIFILSVKHPVLSTSLSPTPIPPYHLSQLHKISSTIGSFTATLTTNDNFGLSISVLQDINGDNKDELAIGAPLDDDGGVDRGAVYILFIQSDGTVDTYTTISHLSGGWTTFTLSNEDHFGSSLANLNDLDNDSVSDIGIGAEKSDEGGTDTGCVYILHLLTTGLVKTGVKISDTTGSFTHDLFTTGLFGSSIALLSDVDDDNMNDIIVGALNDDTFKGAVYLLMLKTSSNVKTYVKIGQTSGGMQTADYLELFGCSVSLIGGYDSDLDSDSIYDIVVGSYYDGTNHIEGCVYIMFMNTLNNVKTFVKISDTSGSFTAVLDSVDYFGASVSSIDNTLYGDIDGDDIQDILVSGYNDDDGGTDRGCVYLVMLNTTGLVKTFSKISSTEGGFTGYLDQYDRFGSSVSSFGSDYDGDGYIDIIVGAIGDNDGNTSAGAIYILSINHPGLSISLRPTISTPTSSPTQLPRYQVQSYYEISNTAGSFTANLHDYNRFGTGITSLSDLNNDNIEDIAVSAYIDDDGGTNVGAVFILMMQSTGKVDTHVKISKLSGGFSGAALANTDFFGWSLGNLDDLDDDAIDDIGVGAPYDDVGLINAGSVWIIHLQSTGLVKTFIRITTPISGSNIYFGTAVAGLGDIDDDSMNDLLIGAWGMGVGGSVILCLLTSNSTMKTYIRISTTSGGMQTADYSGYFGSSASLIGGYDNDLDDDSIYDMVVGSIYSGAHEGGGVYIMFMNTLNNVKTFVKISNTSGSFTGTLEHNDQFGTSVSSINRTLYGDIDGDDIQDMFVGASFDDDGVTDSGCVYIIMLNTTGLVKTYSKISATEGGFTVSLDATDQFGHSVSSFERDFDGDGYIDLLIGAERGDNGNIDAGAVYILSINHPELNTRSPTSSPSSSPTASPTTLSPTSPPTTPNPTLSPTTASPTLNPTTASPTLNPTTASPTTSPTFSPTMTPTTTPTSLPTISPSLSPTMIPTISPTISPSSFPTLSPTLTPTSTPYPTQFPTISPTLSPTSTPYPTLPPTKSPTLSPTTSAPTPTLNPQKVILNTQFANSLSSANLYFNSTYFNDYVNVFDLLSTYSTCNSIFDSDTLSLLGANPQCSWSDVINHILTITLDNDATLVPVEYTSDLLNMTYSDCQTAGSSWSNSIIVLSDDFILHSGMYYATFAINCSFVHQADNPIQPSSIISSSSSVGNCDYIILDGSSSSGSGGRDLEYSWSVNSVYVDEMRNETEKSRMNSIISSSSSSILTISNDDLILNDEVVYEFELEVNNFLDDSDISKKNITIQSENVDVVVGLSIQGGNNKYTTRTNQLTIQTDVDLSWSSECGDNNFNIPSYSLSYTWACISTSPISGNCPDLNDNSLYGNSGGKNIYIPSNYLGLPGMIYEFEVEVELEYTNDDDDNIQSFTSTETVYIEVESNDLIARISGGSSRSILESDILIVNSSLSYDPDEVTGFDITYTWTCEMWDINSDSSSSISCEDNSNSNLFSSSCYSSNINNNILTFNESCLLSDYWYEFELTISKPYTSTSINTNAGSILKTSTTSQSILVNPDSATLPSVYLEPKDTSITKYDTTDKIVIYGSILNENDLSNSLTKRWTQEVGDLGLNTNDDDSSIWREYFSTQQHKRNLVIKSDTLTQGMTYEFKLTVTDDENNVFGFSTISIQTNIGPTSGYLTYEVDNYDIYKYMISSLNDRVTLRALGWTDDGDFPLTYNFGYIFGKVNDIDSISNGDMKKLTTQSQTSTSLSSNLLPQGKQNDDYILTLIVEISDSLDSITKSITNSTSQPNHIQSLPQSEIDNLNADDDITTTTSLCSYYSSYISNNLTSHLETTDTSDSSEIFQTVQVISHALLDFNISSTDEVCGAVTDACGNLIALILATSDATDLTDESLSYQVEVTETVVDVCGVFIDANLTLQITQYIADLLTEGGGSVQVETAKIVLDTVTTVEEESSCDSVALGSAVANLTSLVGSSLLSQQEEGEDATTVAGDDVTLTVSIQSISEISQVNLGDDPETSPYFVFPTELTNSSEATSYSIVGVQYEDNIYAWDDSADDLIMDGVVSLAILDEYGNQVTDFKDYPLTLVIPLPEIDTTVSMSELRTTLDDLECQYWQEEDVECSDEDLSGSGSWVTVGMTTASFFNTSTTNYDNLITIRCEVYHLTEFSAGSSDAAEPDANVINPVDGSGEIADAESLASLSSSVIGGLCAVFAVLFSYLVVREFKSRGDLEVVRELIYIEKGKVPNAGSWDAKSFLKKHGRNDLLVRLGVQSMNEIIKEKRAKAIKNGAPVVRTLNRNQSEGELRRTAYEKEIENEAGLWGKYVSNLYDQHSWLAVFAAGVENRLILSRSQRAMVLWVFLLFQLMANALFLGTSSVTVTDRMKQAWFAAVILIPLQMFLNRLFSTVNKPRPSSYKVKHSLKNLSRKKEKKSIGKVKPIEDELLPALSPKVLRLRDGERVSLSTRAGSRSGSNSRSGSRSGSLSFQANIAPDKFDQFTVEGTIKGASRIWRAKWRKGIYTLFLLLICINLIGFVIGIAGTSEIYFDGQYYPVLTAIQFFVFGAMTLKMVFMFKPILNPKYNATIKSASRNLVLLNSIKRSTRVALIISGIEIILTICFMEVSVFRDGIIQGYSKDWKSAADEASGGSSALERYLSGIEDRLDCCGWRRASHYGVGDCVLDIDTINELDGCKDPILDVFWNFNSRVLSLVAIYLFLGSALHYTFDKLHSRIHLDITKIQMDKKVKSRSGDVSPSEFNLGSKFGIVVGTIITLQSMFRLKKARKIAHRKREFAIWKRNSYLMDAAGLFVYIIAFILVIWAIYMNLLYGLYFNESTARSWLFASFMAITLDGLFFSPLIILAITYGGDHWKEISEKLGFLLGS